jgi:hypothetical protein
MPCASARIDFLGLGFKRSSAPCTIHIPSFSRVSSRMAYILAAKLTTPAIHLPADRPDWTHRQGVPHAQGKLFHPITPPCQKLLFRASTDTPPFATRSITQPLALMRRTFSSRSRPWRPSISPSSRRPGLRGSARRRCTCHFRWSPSISPPMPRTALASTPFR